MSNKSDSLQEAAVIGTIGGNEVCAHERELALY